jgi:hypothetical protein
VKGYFTEDGEHPNDSANLFTAGLLAQMGYQPVSLP